MVTSEEKGVQAEALAKAGHGQRLESWGTARRQGHLAQRKPEVRRGGG